MEKKVKNLKIFLAVLGILFSLPAMAENYGKTLEVTTQGQVIQVRDLVLTPLDQETILTRIKVKNGVGFLVQLPANHQIEQLSGGVLEGDRIRVSSAGSLNFRFVLDQVDYVVLAHINYFGVLQFNGGDAPGVIEVTGGNEDSFLNVKNAEKFGMAWFTSLLNQNNFVLLHDISITNIHAMRLKEIILKAKEQLGSVREFELKVRFYDDTSNQLPDGSMGGLSEHIITIRDLRQPTPSLEVTPTLLSFPENGGSQSVTVTSNQAWSVSSNQPWVKLSPDSGNENGSFTISVEKNSESQSRTAIVTVSAGSLNQTISVTQAGTVITPPSNFKQEGVYQRDAIISWSAGGSEKEWELSYGDLKLIVTEPRAILRELIPGTKTTVQIRAKVDDKFSEPLDEAIETAELPLKANLIPHLYEMNEVFAVGDILPIFWKDLEKVPQKISYNLSPLSIPEEKIEKIFSPLPEAISFSEKGAFILTFKFEGHDEFEEVTFLIEVK